MGIQDQAFPDKLLPVGCDFDGKNATFPKSGIFNILWFYFIF
jgi:hypothetical protein